MPSEDYKPVISGRLQLKGIQGSGIKKKKKRSKPPQQSTSNRDSAKSPPAAGGPSADKHDSDSGSQLIEQHKEEYEESAEREETPLHGRAKTEAEIRHEERRRKRLDERLKREGTKTHKERVEELNRYLSNLSEHHDMPRIGPG